MYQIKVKRYTPTGTYVTGETILEESHTTLQEFDATVSRLQETYKHDTAVAIYTTGHTLKCARVNGKVIVGG